MKFLIFTTETGNYSFSFYFNFTVYLVQVNFYTK